MKRQYSISVEVEDIEVIQEFCGKVGMPMSRLFQDYAHSMAVTIRAVGADRKVKVSKLDLIRIFGKGLAVTL